MPKVSKLVRLELAIEDDKMVGAQATFAESITEGNQTYALGPRRADLGAAGEAGFATVIQDLLGEGLVAATVTAAQATAYATQAQTERDDLSTQLSDLQSKFDATNEALQQLATERDQARNDLEASLGQVRELQSRIDTLEAAAASDIAMR